MRFCVYNSFKNSSGVCVTAALLLGAFCHNFFYCQLKSICVIGPTFELISLHNNIERVKAIVKRYDSGLVWTDAHSGGVDWMTLHPDVVVNRFPRDANAALKLCGHALAGKSEFDSYYPRAYPACTRGIYADNNFVGDYSLTACVSLLRAFVNGGHHTMCAKNGHVSIVSTR